MLFSSHLSLFSPLQAEEEKREEEKAESLLPLRSNPKVVFENFECIPVIKVVFI